MGYARFLKRQFSMPASTISQWWVSRSRRALVFRASEDSGPFSEIWVACDEDGGASLEFADEMQQELRAGLGEREVAQIASRMRKQP